MKCPDHMHPSYLSGIHDPLGRPIEDPISLWGGEEFHSRNDPNFPEKRHDKCSSMRWTEAKVAGRPEDMLTLLHAVLHYARKS